MYGGLLLAVIWLQLVGCGLARSHVNQSSTSDAPTTAPSAVALDRRSFNAAPPGGSRVFSHSFGAAQGFHCFRQSTCEPMQHPYCFGTKLSYTNTSLNLATGVTSQQQAHSDLRDWEFVRFVPRCWNVLQPLLCAVYLPPCSDSRVEQPSLEMCKTARELCRFADALLKWPSFMECTESHFPSRCESKLVKVKYDLPGYCLPPLVSTNNSLAYFPGLEGCAEPCRGLLYTQQESRQLHRFLHVFGGLSFALTLLTVLTYVIDWHTFSKYVANRCIFFINLCLCVSILGFLVQFMDESRHTVVCHTDGTRRGPGSEESSSPCTAVFAMIYYPSIAAMCWFIMLAFSWHVTLKTFGQSRGVQERLDALMSYFHLICWSVPLVLSTAALATADVVDSDYMYGICFVGFKNMQYRIGFVLAPALVAAVVGGFFLVRCVLFLLKYGPGRHAKQLVIAASVARLAVCGLLVLVAVLASIGCHVIEYADLHRRTAQLTEHILCLANTTARYDYGRSTEDQCSVASKSPLAVLKAHSFCLFGVGILFSSWVWRRSTLRSWNKFYHRLVGRPDQDDRWTGRRMGKHRVIAQAWTKRYDLARNRRISLSFRSTYSDPVGIFGGLGTESSASPSSSFLAAIPNLLVRRGALIGSTSSALGLSRRTSNGSLYSMYSRPHSRYSRRSRCSRRSGRLSLDSQMSDRRHSLDSTRSLTDVERVAMLLGGRDSRTSTAAGPPGARRRGRRRALAEVRRGLRAGGRRSQRRHTAGSEVTLSRRSSTVSRASSSIKSQLAHALEFLSRPHRQPLTGRALMSAAAVADGGASIADGGGGRHRRHRAGSSSTAAAVEPEPATAAGGHDNCSYVHTENDPLVAAAGEAEEEAVEAADIVPRDGRRSAGSSVRTASRQSRGHGSNVSSGSSILNLAQRLRGDVTEFTRPRRRVGADAAGSSTPTRVVEAAIELTKLPTRRCSGNQSAVSVAVQTANQQPAFSAQAPIGCEATNQDARGLTLRNNLHEEQPMDRLNNGRLSPYSKNARRMSVAADVEADDVADKVVNISMRSSSTRSSKSRTSALDDDPLPEVF